MWLYEGKCMDMVQIGGVLLVMLCVHPRQNMVVCAGEKLIDKGKEGVLKAILKEEEHVSSNSIFNQKLEYDSSLL